MGAQAEAGQDPGCMLSASSGMPDARSLMPFDPGV